MNPASRTNPPSSWTKTPSSWTLLASVHLCGATHSQLVYELAMASSHSARQCKISLELLARLARLARARVASESKKMSWPHVQATTTAAHIYLCCARRSPVVTRQLQPKAKRHIDRHVHDGNHCRSAAHLIPPTPKHARAVYFRGMLLGAVTLPIPTLSCRPTVPQCAAQLALLQHRFRRGELRTNRGGAVPCSPRAQVDDQRRHSMPRLRVQESRRVVQGKGPAPWRDLQPLRR